MNTVPSLKKIRSIRSIILLIISPNAAYRSARFVVESTQQRRWNEKRKPGNLTGNPKGNPKKIRKIARIIEIVLNEVRSMFGKVAFDFHERRVSEERRNNSRPTSTNERVSSFRVGRYA